LAPSTSKSAIDDEQQGLPESRDASALAKAAGIHSDELTHLRRTAA
jgi:hypothetical protein